MKTQEARALLPQGITPRQQAKTAQAETMSTLMGEWREMKAKTLAPSTLKKLWLSITRHVIPAMGQ